MLRVTKRSKDLRIGRATRDGFLLPEKIWAGGKSCAVRDPKESAEWMFRVRGGNATRRGSKADTDWRTVGTDPARVAFLA
jgi:hypothetical protein